MFDTAAWNRPATGRSRALAPDVSSTVTIHIRYRDVLNTASGVVEVQGLTTDVDGLHSRTCLFGSPGPNSNADVSSKAP